MIGKTNSFSSSQGGVQVPLDPPSNLVVKAANAKASFTWTDPLDKYAISSGEDPGEDGQLVSQWAYTKIIRKVGSQPTGPNDGTPVLETTTRNQYQTTAYTDQPLVNNETYYYAAYAYNTDGVVSEGCFTEPVIPKAFEPVLNDNTWEQIKSVAAAGVAPSAWSVGDCKQIVLNGTLTDGIGSITLENFFACVFILGFNHNADLEGNNTIHFMLGKSTLSGGKDITLSDSLNQNLFVMNDSSPQIGWEDCLIRKTIIGTNPNNLNGTFFGIISADLRQAIKPVTKYTDNWGNTNSLYEDENKYVTATTDYVFLLSEFEVFGMISAANPYEASFQQQYSYYASGNSKIKYMHDQQDTASGWWLRSPCDSWEDSFAIVDYQGRSNSWGATYPCDFAPAFAVG